jgi:hypothetical protein
MCGSSALLAFGPEWYYLTAGRFLVGVVAGEPFVHTMTLLLWPFSASVVLRHFVALLGLSVVWL